MSTIEVDKIIPQSGTATQLGESGDTITIPAGATITNNGTANGFGSADTEKVKVSSNDTTAGFLNGKLVAGTNISLTEGTDGGNETLTAALSGTIGTSQIADDAITLAKMAPGTDGNIISYDASGNPVAVATGTAGQVLTSAGAGAPPTFAAAGGITIADSWRITASFNFSSQQTIDVNWERVDSSGQGTIGSAMTQSSGIFTFPSTGIYLVIANCGIGRSGSTRYIELQIQHSSNSGGAYDILSRGNGGIGQVASGTNYDNVTVLSTVDVTNTSTQRLRFRIEAEQESTFSGNSSYNEGNSFQFIRLGDT